MQDLLDQLKTIQRMGPLRELFAKLPGVGSIAEQLDERELVKVEAMIRSMTPRERTEPETIQKSRAARIARGSGRRSKEVLELVQRFRQMREMMGALGGGGGLLSRIPGLGRLTAGAPGFDPQALLSGAGRGGTAASGGASARRDEGKRRRAQQKRKRKQARKDRRKGRRR
jgi:hypothetical protein